MEWAARAIGVVYVLGGLALLHQAWSNWRLQRALAKLITLRAAEQAADTLGGLGGALIFLSGFTLAILSAWAVLAFVAGWAVQAAYLLWAFGRVRPFDRSLAPARKHSLRAFGLYTVVTGVVLYLPLTGLLN